MNRGNYILINKKKYTLTEGEPINSYTKLNPTKLDIRVFSSGTVGVGYFAQWILQDNRLYLSHFDNNDLFSNNFEEQLKDNGNLFFACWFSGNLVIQIGDVINRHIECGETLQYNFILSFKKGILIDTIMKDNHYINRSMDEILKKS